VYSKVDSPTRTDLQSVITGLHAVPPHLNSKKSDSGLHDWILVDELQPKLVTIAGTSVVATLIVLPTHVGTTRSI
jgi:hypothetical protein